MRRMREKDYKKKLKRENDNEEGSKLSKIDHLK